MKLREKQSELSFSPVLFGEAVVASRAVQPAGDSTCGSQQPHSPQDRVQTGVRRRTKVGRMGIAGNLD